MSDQSSNNPTPKAQSTKITSMNSQSITRANRRSGWKPIETVPAERVKGFAILGGNSMTKNVAVLYWDDCAGFVTKSGEWVLGHGDKAYGFDLWKPLPIVY